MQLASTHDVMITNVIYMNALPQIQHKLLTKIKTFIFFFFSGIVWYVTIYINTRFEII
jgi:hypothetical protein